MSSLKIMTGKSTGTLFELNKAPLTIGREEDCTIRLPDALVSRRHARVFAKQGQWWIEDLGSRNRTRVNEQELAEAQPLDRGDRIEIGETTLVFETEVDLLNQTLADEPVLSSPVQEETIFEDSAEPFSFRDQTFDRGSLELLYQVASVLNAELTLASLAQKSLQAIKTFFAADLACLFLTKGRRPPVRPALVLSEQTSPMISQTVVWQSMQSRRAICVRDSREELPAGDVLNQLDGETSRSLMCAPLIRGGNLLGAILIDRSERSCFDRESLTLFTAIAHLVGNAIFHLRQIEKLQANAPVIAEKPGPVEALAGKSPEMEILRQQIVAVANSDEPVLIAGERGTGKRQVAAAIQRQSPRADGPLEWFHCVETEPEEIAATLFGVAGEGEGGSGRRRTGKLEAAHGGTLVIEEIGALPEEIQTELLAYVKTLKFKRVGSERRDLADVRVIATTSEPLEKKMAAKRFCDDLYRAISAQTVKVPPLRERGNDAVDLAMRIAERVAPCTGRRTVSIPPMVMRALMGYAWPGNVRELHCVVERAVLRSQGRELRLADLPADLAEQVPQTATPTIVEDPPLREAVREYEKEVIHDTLPSTGGDRTRASQILDVSPRTLERKLHDYDMDEHPPPRKKKS